jgi:hypothetical protein
MPARSDHHSLTRFDTTQSQDCNAMPCEEKADLGEEDEDEECNDPSLRSLIMGMMDQMRKMQLENAQLHNTIADLCARQAHT